MAKLNLLALTKTIEWRTETFDYRLGDNTFIDYILEDKSKYVKMCDVFNDRTGRNHRDVDDDFLLGNSGGVLMNINFVFINTDIFSRTADHFMKFGTYCEAQVDSPEYNKFWNRETARRKRGATAKCKLYYKDINEYFNDKTTEVRKKELLHDLRITGDHYNYLNYGRIERTPNEIERKKLDSEGLYKVETVPGFPRSWDGDYWNFKIDEFIGNNKYHLAKAKARRKGFSYKRGSQAANTLNLNKGVTVVLAADIIDYLTDPEATTDMAKKNLDWLETNTYWRRGYISESMESIELGYKKKNEGNKKFGYRSKLLSVAIGRNESAAVGKKAIEIDFEESGKSPNLQKALDVTLSNVESGAIVVGTIRVYGTGGTKGANWKAFMDCFFNPSKNSMLAFENVWDKDSRHQTCGFFFPQIWNLEPYIWQANSLLFDAFLWDRKDKLRAKDLKDSYEYIIYCAQRANTPAEAFINTTENLFATPELNVHVNNLLTDPNMKFYQDGWYIVEDGKTRFINRTECIQRNIFGDHKFHEYIMDVPHNNKTDVHGCVREYYPPFYINGEIPKDLYFASLDPYKVDKLSKEVTGKHSLYSFKIWMYNRNYVPYRGKRIMAEYCGRLDSMALNDRELLKALNRWNCGVLIEAGTGETINNFKTWEYRNKLMKDPTAFTDRSITNRQNIPYGIVIGDGDTKIEGLGMLRDYMYEIIGRTDDGSPIYRLHDTYSIGLCLEEQRYNSNDNFDRISDAIVAMYEFRKDTLLNEKKQNEKYNPNTKRLADRLNAKS